MPNLTKVYLLNTPLEEDLKNTLYFDSATLQHNYMESKIIKSYTDVSYQRDTSSFRCPAQVDSIRNCNYLMYQNTSYSNKWFYGFITKMTYVNDKYTDVEFTIDPLQTFMFDITIKPSFVEREHTNDDTVGNNTIPENIELGEYINSGYSKLFTYNPIYCYPCIAVTKLFTGSTECTPGTYSPSNALLPDGLYYVGLENNSAIKSFIKYYDGKNAKDAIVSVFVVPKECFTGAFSNSPQGFKYSLAPTMYFNKSESVNKPSGVGSYNPRNKKLLTFPYRFVQASNNSGEITNYNYEDFSTSSMNFGFRFGLSSSGSGRVFPNNYKGKENNYDEGINFGKLPVGSWSSDLYTNWMTQNGVNLALAGLGSGASIVGGIASKNPAGIMNGIRGITDIVSQVYEHSLEPPQAQGNVCNGDVNYVYSMTEIVVMNKCIKPEYARIADDYFDMFGYATHRVKVPFKNHRANWWYTKTIDCNITGNVPNDYIQEIKSAYNNGVTFWKNPSNFLNYSVNNGII